MEVKGTTLPGYRVFDYQLIINPHEDLRNRITEVRNELNKEFKVANPVKAKPNLPLVYFKQYEMIEERIVNRLKLIAMEAAPFKVEIKDFGSFPAHTIFMNVLSKLPIQGLVKQVRSETQKLMKFDEDNKPYFHLEPHITIARKLKPWQYEAAWLKYSRAHFTGRFIANEMLLIKRLEGEKTWIIAQRMEFKNMPVIAKQGELF